MKHDVSATTGPPMHTGCPGGKGCSSLATAGDDALEGFVCDSSPARLETGNLSNLDSTMMSSSPSSLLMLRLGGPAMAFSVYS